MKLYLLSQDVNTDYDTYDSCVVCAKNEEDAKTIHPSNRIGPVNINRENYGSWCGLNDVKVEYIGRPSKGLKRGVICASFNAG